MITDETLVSLRENDERFDNLFFYLDDFSFGDDDNDFDDDTNNNDTANNNPNNLLAQALRGNTQVVAVDVDMHLDEPMNRHIEGLMTGIGQLQNLQSLRCSSSGDYAVTMAALTHTLVASQQLTAEGGDNNSTTNKLVSLDLANFLLQNNQDCDEHSLAVQSYHDFVAALRHHPTLERFHLGFGFSSSASVSMLPSSAASTAAVSSFIVSEEEDIARTAHHCLTPLLESLMTLPSLDSIRLDGAGFSSPTYLTPEGLAAVLNGTASSSPVTILELSGFDLTTAHIEGVAKALEANSSNLKVLSLSCTKFVAATTADKGSAGAVSLAQAVQNNTRLESLTLPLQSLLVVNNSGQAPPDKKSQNRNKNANCSAMIEFFQALEMNRTLKRLQLNGPDDEATLAQIGDVLTSPAVIEAFRHMLQHNYGLEFLYLGYPQVFSEGDWQAEINLHTKLNSMGRGRLVRDASITRDQWMESFGAVQDDLSCLFHLLHLNPLLCGDIVAT